MQTSQGAQSSPRHLENPQATQSDSLLPRLNPAIFIPITSFPTSSLTLPSVTLSQEEQLQKIVTNLTAQHETVKHNMLIVARDRARELRTATEKELKALGDVEEPLPDPTEEGVKRRKVEEMVQKLRAKPRSGVKPVELEVRPPTPGVRGNWRVVNVETSQRPRTPAFIRSEIVVKLQQLIDDTVDELAAYDARSKLEIAHYQSLLDVERRRNHPPGYGNHVATNSSGSLKRKISFSATHSPSVNSPGERPYGQAARGILRQGYTPSPKEIEALTRMRENDQIPLTAREEEEEDNLQKKVLEQAQESKSSKQKATSDKARRNGMV